MGEFESGTTPQRQDARAPRGRLFGYAWLQDCTCARVHVCTCHAHPVPINRPGFALLMPVVKLPTSSCIPPGVGPPTAAATGCALAAPTPPQGGSDGCGWGGEGLVSGLTTRTPKTPDGACIGARASCPRISSRQGQGTLREAKEASPCTYNPSALRTSLAECAVIDWAAALCVNRMAAASPFRS